MLSQKNNFVESFDRPKCLEIDSLALYRIDIWNGL